MAFGKVVPAGVWMPSNEEWGSYGWTFVQRESAERKFLELVREHGDVLVNVT